MMKRALIVLICAVALFVGGGAFQKAEAQDPEHVIFSSMGIGSAWYVMAANIAKVMRENLPPNSTIDVLPYGGGVGSNKMIAQGKSDMAIVFNTSASWAYNGRVAFDKPIEEVRGLVGGLDKYYQAIVVRKGLDIDSLADIKKKKLPVRLFTTRPSGAGETGARLTLAAYGITYDDIKAWGGSVEHTSHGAIIAAFKDGRADIFMHCITKGHPSATEISVSTDVKFLSVNEAAIKEMQGFGYTDATMPKGLFRGQDYEVRLPGITSNIIVNKNMNYSLAYTITKSICENKDALVKGHPAFGPFDPKQAWKLELVGVPLHPGAEKYYKEKGWMK